MKETDLAKPVIAWLSDQHWEVYQEVQFSYGSSIADIVAVRNGIMWIIESKMSYGFDVLQQASRWPVHYRSIAIPSNKHNHRDYGVAEHYYRVGVLEVKVEYDDVWEIVKAPLVYRKINQVNYYRSKLVELHKTFAPAGSKSGQHLTPYKWTMREVKRVIEANPGCTIKDLYLLLGKMHYSNAGSFKGNLLKALIKYESWCKVDMNIKPYRLFVSSG